MQGPADEARLVALALVLVHLMASVLVTTLLYNRELLMRLEYLRLRGAQVPPWLAPQWTMRYVTLLGAAAVQVLLFCTLL